MTANTYGRQVVVPLTNKSGGSVAAGDVVVVDTTNNDAFTTTTSAAFTGGVGVAQETIANNATGRVLISGYAALVNVNASVTRGQFGATHTVAKQAAGTASRGTGTFCQWLTGGTTPDAIVYPVDLLGSSLTNPMTTGGDTLYGGASGVPTRLANGSAGQHLQSAGGTAAPIWATPALTLISSSVLGAPAANFDLTSIPATYNHLELILVGRGSTAAVTISFSITFNNDGGANYDSQNDYASGGATGNAQAFAQTSLPVGSIPASTATASLPGLVKVWIPMYAATTFKKIVNSTQDLVWGTSNTGQTQNAAGLWRSTAAISRITATPGAGNFDTGSAVYLYGII